MSMAITAETAQTIQWLELGGSQPLCFYPQYCRRGQDRQHGQIAAAHHAECFVRIYASVHRDLLSHTLVLH